MPITGRPGFPVPVETAGGGNWSMLVAGRLWVAGFGSPALGQRSGMSFAVAVDSGRGDRVSEGDTDLDALLAGDKAAWDRFVARHAGVIFAAVRRLQIGRASGGERECQVVVISGVAVSLKK